VNLIARLGGRVKQRGGRASARNPRANHGGTFGKLSRAGEKLGAFDLVGRGSRKTARFTREIDGYKLTRSVAPKNAPSRDSALDHGSARLLV